MNRLNQKMLFGVGTLGAGLLMQSWAAAAQSPDPSTPTSPGPPSAAAPASRDSAPVTLHMRDTPLRAALQTLFEGSGLQHAVEPAVPNYPMTLDVRDVPFSSALRTLLRLAPGVTFRKEGEIYIIGMRQPTPEPTSSYVEPAPPVDIAVQPGQEQWEKIPINYLHPAVVAYVLNGRLVPNEVELQTGLGGGGGYGGFSGQGGNGFNSGLNGGGLGPAGNGGSGYGIPGGYGQASGVNGYQGSGYPGSFNGLGQGTSYGSPIVGNNGALIGPQPRRF